MEPCTFLFEVTAEGIARPGFGVIAAYVPAAEGWPAVVVLASDPVHDPGRAIETMVPAAIQYVIARTGFAEANLCCVAIDALGHFAKAVPHWGGCPTPVVTGIELSASTRGTASMPTWPKPAQPGRWPWRCFLRWASLPSRRRKRRRHWNSSMP
ncbi:MAG: hypothetical protein WC681_14195 [Sterolibacterium sp.]